jgi:hypothetical protein
MYDSGFFPLLPGSRRHNLAFSFNPKTKIMDNNLTPLPPSFIPYQTGEERINRFLNSRHQAMSANAGREDTRSIWYTLEHIKKIYEELQLQDADGMRVYFGVYGDQEEYPGQTCLIMRPTHGNANGESIDIKMETTSNFADRLDLYNKSKDMNLGRPCPPRCPNPGD